MSDDPPLAVSVCDVSKSFGVRVVDGMSLDVAPGEAVGIVGPNGAGKTTLLNLIAGDLYPDEGSVSIVGRNVTRMRPERRCRLGLARTAQIPRPFEGLTVYENVLVGATYGSDLHHAQSADVAVDALGVAQLLDKANRPASSIGLLDRKRLELARALATQPSVLLLDEIAGGLTDSEVSELVEVITELHASGITIVWIEHIVHALMAVVERIMAMSVGKKIADGDPHEVMTSDAVRSEYLGSVE
ncbi:MAG: ABC transporter ATP-binding protein [Actinomycetota bacterium]